ncbi:hypothetical protein AAVH_34923, partial [Aphelenchoides avenae]
GGEGESTASNDNWCTSYTGGGGYADDAPALDDGGPATENSGGCTGGDSGFSDSAGGCSGGDSGGCDSGGGGCSSSD